MKTLSASELATITAEACAKAIVSQFASLGLIQVTIHPNAIPANVTGTKRASTSRATVSAPAISAPRVSLPSVPAVNVSKSRPANVTSKRDIPKYGDFHAGVGTGRVKLPMGLFAEHSEIILRLPHGEDFAVEVDSEGRGRLPLAQTRAMGAIEGDTLVFTNTMDNVFEVSIHRGNSIVRPNANTSKVSASAPKVTAPKVKAKREATPAQLKAREAFATKHRVVRCACGNMPKVSELPKGTIIDKGHVAECAACNRRPVMVVTQPTRKQARVEESRKQAHKGAASKQKAFAASKGGYVVPPSR